MKIFTENGASVSTQKTFDKFYSLTCGEEGRGRTLGFIPVVSSLQGNEIVLDGSYNVTTTRKNNLLLVPSDDKGVIIVTRWYGGYRGGITHNLEELEITDEAIEILAVGHTAEGDAGRMGGEDQYILKIKKSCKIVFEKHGRLYGKPKKWITEVDIENEKVRCYPAEADVDLEE